MAKIGSWTSKIKRDEPVLRDEAFIGIVGDIARFLAKGQYTEAHPVGHLVSSLAFLQHVIGPMPKLQWGSLRVSAMGYWILISPTEGGKSQSANDVLLILHAAYPTLEDETFPGVQSTAALAEELTSKASQLDEGRRRTKFDLEAVERMLYDRELGGVFATKERDTKFILSLIEMYDGKPFKYHRKGFAVSAQVHMPMLLHVVPHIFQRVLNLKDIHGGFINRCLPLYMPQRIKNPDIKALNVENRQVKAFVEQIREIAAWAREKERTVTFTPQALREYKDYYRHSDTDFGHEDLNEMLRRKDDHVRRLAHTYAACACTEKITVAHLHAARAIVDYRCDSMLYLFDEDDETPTAYKRINAMIREAYPNALTTTEIYRQTGNNLHRAFLDEALDWLEKHHRITSEHTTGKTRLYRAIIHTL